MGWSIDRKSVEEGVKKVLEEELGVEAQDIKPESLIEDELGADSLDVVQIAMSMEKEFGIEIPDDKAAEIKTVQQAVDKVCEILGITE